MCRTLNGSIVDRLLYVGNLPFDVTQSTVGDLFPGALRLIFPPLKEIDQSVNTARYVYLEYESAEEVTKAAEKYKDVVLNDENLFVIKALCIKKERFGGFLTNLSQTFLFFIQCFTGFLFLPKPSFVVSHWFFGTDYLFAEIMFLSESLQENLFFAGISLNMDKLSTDSKHRKGWGMELGALDEERIEKEELDKPDNSSQKMGGMRSNRGASRGSYDSRRPNSSNLGQHQRYGNVGSYNNYGSNAIRPGWSAGNYYGASGFANHGFMNQGYSQGYNAQHGSFYGNKRKASDNYGGDWKRGRPF
ncbi:hypothetical protein HELRODRAFT_187854 [Helobdella robusta]|uniref:RRM domain-containing protein n=1 Tax=Helobdella robusta TaxID=6412 RepID=T1FPF5_HELRO|nr:hypothetical protein HELRODRAFT_187854 [Helobdella robusta]ESO12391.1 hypothetical protein HELRODRAFT_187854 [Helobdella robusta]